MSVSPKLCPRRTSTRFRLTMNRGSPAMNIWSVAFARTSDGMPPSWSHVRTMNPMASVDTSPHSQVQRRSMKWASIISSVARPTAHLVTTCISKDMQHPASMRAHFLKVAWTKTTLITFVARLVATAKDSRVTRTHGSCQSSGSTPLCPWGSDHSLRSITHGSIAISTTVILMTHQLVACGHSSVMARQMNQRHLAPSHLRHANTLTI